MVTKWLVLTHISIASYYLNEAISCMWVSYWVTWLPVNIHSLCGHLQMIVK